MKFLRYHLFTDLAKTIRIQIIRLAAKISIDMVWLGRIGNFPDPFDFERWGETMANFSKVQDFADRTIHEYTGWVQAITLITLNFLRALFPHNANKLLRMKVASRNIIPLSMNRVFKRVFKVSRFFYPSSLNGIYFQL